MDPMVLDNIDIVLVEPRGPGNVGSTARALKNFGMSRLVVVNGPRLNHPQATAMAVKAGDLLRSARTTEALPEAIADATFVIATTAKRRYRLPTLRPREAGERIVEQAARGRVAILFGREDHGLDDAELRLAHETIAIETAPGCRALNISQAVLLIAYEVWLAAGSRGAVADSDPGRLITADMRHRLESELLDTLKDVGIMHDGNDIACEQSIQRLMTLGPMQTRDSRVLFALARRIRELMRSMDHPDR
ncbi:MAG: TrmH family RNA methyltransferase [Planctomycetota bacterium]|nr:tRNA (cytosine(32)/uridine(32)-2'-O)-methyltransferase TrmJ [Planctomycetota bacterium]MEE2713399.1 TrmH family RNA methyltransferase [Planctomycetota bacterium]